MISEPEVLLGRKAVLDLQRRRIEFESQKISELTYSLNLRTFWPLGVPTRVEPISDPI